MAGAKDKAEAGAKSKSDTRIVHGGRRPADFHGAVNTPVFHASTILFETLEDFESRGHGGGKTSYGRYGTPTSFALEEAVADLQGGDDCCTLSSGLAAIACALMALVKAGDHILVTDTAYAPTRRFCDEVLSGFGVETTYYDPLIAGKIETLFRPNTRLVYTETPGSLTFEMQDLRAIAAAAGRHDVLVMADTTWATPINLKPFELGVDVAVEAGTKYVVGHSDAMLGLITSKEPHASAIRRKTRLFGQCSGPDDVYLALRGLRTLSVRLERHAATGLRLARWLSERPEIGRVLHPALPGDPGHALWKRDFTGACGLFGLVLAKPYPKAAVAALIEGLDLFGLGASWGGYESLILTGYPERTRSATTWTAPGPLLRIHAGLEDPDDLIADLEAGLARLEAAAADPGHDSPAG